MNKPVTFELAKLLKEKGFNDFTDLGLSYRIKINPDAPIGIPTTDEDTWFFNVKESIAAPSVIEAVLWLFTRHKIQLFLDYIYYDGFYYGVKWTMSNGDCGEVWKDNMAAVPDGVSTWEEAFELAITYCLNEKLK